MTTTHPAPTTVHTIPGGPAAPGGIRRLGVATVLGTLLPPGVECAEAFGPPPEGPLLGPEAEHIKGRTPRRRRQFTAARTLARTTLTALGHPPVPLVPGPGGAPQWPEGVTGSITHTHGYTACATAPTARLASLGIDAEPAQPLPHGPLQLVTSEAERHHLAGLPAGRVPWDRLLFSAKEAVYKAGYPLTRRWIPLAAITVTLDRGHGFTAHHPDLPDAHRGRWTMVQNVLITALVIPRTEEPAGQRPLPEVDAPR
ncbi:4'-phosphopantetheinyl transferase superfamily protein [Kitasatospora sp. NPDC048538]|uniref:4'-phosphopantetheinyl transferase family protein n=1 Tax=unclassified Kitasatospora TaxID=2633591 RepID=UPI0033F6E3CC